jgi:hypothetical protein
MGDFHVKKIILPSGKAVEIVYFHAEAEQETPGEPAQATAEAGQPSTPPASLECCPSCASGLVYPVDWREVDEQRWELELRCPNCEWSARSTHSQAEVEAYDEVLNQGTDVLIEALETVTRENMEADIERFVQALESGLIQPLDF